MPVAVPGVTAATAWAIQHSDFAEALARITFYQGQQGARIFRLFDTRTAGHRPLTTGPRGALQKVLLKWIVYYASGVYSEHVRVVRIHPRYRGTPPNYPQATGTRPSG